jgi:hypothetical protein
MNAPVQESPKMEPAVRAPALLVFRDFVRALERLAAANEKRAARAPARRRRVQG